MTTSIAPPELIVVGFDEEPSDAEAPTSIKTWQPPALSKDKIDKKAKLATLRKQQALASKTAKASKFTKKASATYHLKQAQDEEGIFEATKALETKISSAGSRRMSLTTKIVAKLSARTSKNKANKARLSEEDSDKLVEIVSKSNERMHAAEGRRSSKQAKQVAKVVKSHQKKIVAAAEAKHASLTLAKDKGETLEQRLAAAQARKELLVAEQVETLVQSHHDKAIRNQETLQQKKHLARDGSARLANKIRAAEGRRAKAMQKKLPTDTTEDKVARFEAVKARDTEAATELLEKNTSKLSEAEGRRTTALQEKSNKISVKAQVTAKRLESKKETSDVATGHLRDLLNEKMARAEENRQEHLAQRTINSSNNSSFAFSSPSKSPVTALAIDRKLEAAAARRDMYLLTRSATKRTNRTLIAGDFPTEDEDVDANMFPALSLAHSPPAKKPRLENVKDQGGKKAAKKGAVEVSDNGSGPLAEKWPHFNIFGFLQDFFKGVGDNFKGILSKLVSCFRR